jgi:hypothetical protein
MSALAASYLIADFTDMRVEHAHVAISHVPCQSDGLSPFAVLVANANVGEGNTQFAVVPLNSGNLVNDVSNIDIVCTYHIDIDADDYDFPVTDIALANTDFVPHTLNPPASATISAELVKIEE